MSVFYKIGTRALPFTLGTVEGGSTAVVAGRTPVLSPLIGGPRLTVYDARWERGHRRVGYALGGQLRTPGRYAVDWVKLDSSGRKWPAGSDLAAQAYGHGQDVLAVADGVVVQVHDQAAERTRLADRPAGTPGNHLVLTGGRHAMEAGPIGDIDTRSDAIRDECRAVDPLAGRCHRR